MTRSMMRCPFFLSVSLGLGPVSCSVELGSLSGDPIQEDASQPILADSSVAMDPAGANNSQTHGLEGGGNLQRGGVALNEGTTKGGGNATGSGAGPTGTPPPEPSDQADDSAVNTGTTGNTRNDLPVDTTAVVPTNIAGAYLVTPSLSACAIEHQNGFLIALCAVDFSQLKLDAAKTSANVTLEGKTSDSPAFGHVGSAAAQPIKISSAASEEEARSKAKALFKAMEMQVQRSAHLKFVTDAVSSPIPDTVLTLKDPSGEIFVYARSTSLAAGEIVSGMNLKFQVHVAPLNYVSSREALQAETITPDDAAIVNVMLAKGLKIASGYLPSIETSPAPTPSSQPTPVMILGNVSTQAVYKVPLSAALASNTPVIEIYAQKNLLVGPTHSPAPK